MKPSEFVDSYINLYKEKESLIVKNNEIKELDTALKSVYEGQVVKKDRLIELDNVYEQMVISHNGDSDASNEYEQQIANIDNELGNLSSDILLLFSILQMDSIVTNDNYRLYVSEGQVFVEKM